MPAIIEIPTVVAEAMQQFSDLFANEPQRQHLAEYLTGLMVGHRKTVNGMASEFAVTTDQSCWNRFLTEAEWSVEAFNAAAWRCSRQIPPHDTMITASLLLMTHLSIMMVS